MKQIPLTQNKFTLVDDEDYGWLMQWKWHTRAMGRTYYASRTINLWENGKRTTRVINMHREILGLSRGDGKETDHINHKGWDNQKHNLRICSRDENNQNLLPRKNCSSKYKGVGRHYDKWRARIGKGGTHLGVYVSEIVAARVYDAKAIELYGRFAHVNFPDEWPPEFQVRDV